VKPFWILDFGFLLGTSQNNKLLVLALSTLLPALSGSADAQQPVHLPRVGVLLALPQAAIADRIQAYQEGLRELGYFEGKTILMDYRSADGKFDRLSDLARELVRLKVNVIVTGGPTATRPAKEATTEIPIVMAQDTDPVGNGFVASLARPAGNITGLSNYHPELSGKQLELLKEIIPRLARVAIVGNSNEPGNAQALKETEVAARALGLQPYYFDARDAKAIETVLRSASKERADAVLVLSSPIATSHRKELAEIAAKSPIPAMYQVSESVEAGGLMTYGVSTADLWRRAAIYVDKILKGRKPAELPVEQPTKFELVINLKTAKQIGLAVPQSVLARADKVIK
jgi:putative tryptophan/tyrosine transport system substrate-binding protein